MDQGREFLALIGLDVHGAEVIVALALAHAFLALGDHLVELGRRGVARRVERLGEVMSGVIDDVDAADFPKQRWMLIIPYPWQELKHMTTPNVHW